MNKYVRACFVLPFSVLKTGFTKICHPKNFKASLINMFSPSSQINVSVGGKLKIGKLLKMQNGSKISVLKKGEITVGKNLYLGTNSVIVCQDKVEIGDNTEIAPNVMIYDHDHDFRHADGLKSNNYKTSPVKIGNNVWIGANTVILRGCVIGDNSVIGAGSVIKGEFPANSVITQKRETIVKEIIR